LQLIDFTLYYFPKIGKIDFFDSLIRNLNKTQSYAMLFAYTLNDGECGLSDRSSGGAGIKPLKKIFRR